MTYQTLVERLVKTRINSVYFIFIHPYQFIELPDWLQMDSPIVLHDGRNVSVFGVN